MRILNVNSTLDPVWGGGGAERIRRLSSALARQGHQVTVLTTSTEPSALDKIAVTGAQVVALRCLNRRFLLPVFPFGRLRKLIREHDIVHLSGHWTILNAVVYWLARAESKPYAVSPVGTLPLFGRSRRLKATYNRFVGRAIIRNAQAHVAVTPAELPQFRDYGVAPDGVAVIPNGVDAEAFNEVDSTDFRIRNDLGMAPLILFMGRLNPIKGPDLLVEAFARIAQRYPSYLLVLAGPNEGMEAGLRETVQRYGIAERVRFVGYVGGKEKIAAYRAATLLAIPSRQEAMSIVVLEGGAAGIPVLITDQCGFDMVEQIGGGRVVSADASAIAAGLAAMLDDPLQLPDAGQRLCNLVRGEFTWDVAASRLAEVFAAALRRTDSVRALS
jgi:glycosyltransferase involved in cell wall biosynthesis